MAERPNIIDIATGTKYNTSDLNSRFNTLADAFENVWGLSGTGETTNTVVGDLDMNTNRVRNLGAPAAANDAIRLRDLQDAADLDSGLITLRSELASTTNGEGASLIGVEDSGGYFVSTDVEAALAEAAVGINDHDADTEVHGVTGAVVGTTNTQTLTNKTLDSPTITGSFKGALVKNSVAQTLTNNTQVIPVWDTEVYDVGEWHEGVINPNRLTVPAGISHVRLAAMADVDALLGAGFLRLSILKNGSAAYDGFTSYNHTDGTTYANYIMVTSPVLAVSPGDYFTALVQQNGGATENLQTASWFAIEQVL